MISRRTNETLAFSPCTFPVYFSMHSSCTQLKRTASKHYERLVVYVIRLHGRRCGNVHGYIRSSIRRIRGFLYGVRARGIHLHEEGSRTICQEAVPGRRSKFQCFFPLVAVLPIRDFPPREIFHLPLSKKSRGSILAEAYRGD